MTEDRQKTDAAAKPTTPMGRRFRGFLPVVIDVETGGFNAATDALLEIAAVHLRLDDDGMLVTSERHRYIVKPAPGLNLEPMSLQVTGIDPYHPLRPHIEEADALRELFKHVRREVKAAACTRAILVGHNPFFDLSFLNAAVERNRIKRNPFHPFSTFDTATLGGVAFGQTVLSRAVTSAGFSWDEDQAHSALYDAEMTARLFCEAVNRYQSVYSG